MNIEYQSICHQIHFQADYRYRSAYHIFMNNSIVLLFFGFSNTNFEGRLSWSPLCALCLLRLFLHLGYFGFLLLYHIFEELLAFFPRLCVNVEFLSFFIGFSVHINRRFGLKKYVVNNRFYNDFSEKQHRKNELYKKSELCETLTSQCDGSGDRKSGQRGKTQIDLVHKRGRIRHKR